MNFRSAFPQACFTSSDGSCGTTCAPFCNKECMHPIRTMERVADFPWTIATSRHFTSVSAVMFSFGTMPAMA
ncbi:unnamed protein product [Pseudo-nitzschia multistriata]|uniref:Uncharacterized protein n=1 Tax=Pseudo-nitzschia multistriata TaxID=183589 RepID=A0A448Z7G7_9STRA|nr:unnamed protein product [Pseudo-nitzschia multistriata]